MPPSSAEIRPYQVKAGQPLTVDIEGADGTKLRVRGVLDRAPDGYGQIKTRLVLVDAVARVLED